MLFNSYTFLVFFVFVLGLHALPLPWKLRKFNLLCVSYLFYAAWNPPFVLLLWFSTVVDWFIARRLPQVKDKHRKRALVSLSLLANLGLLGFFKYSGFMLDNFQHLVQFLGMDFRSLDLGIILPVGISFYTFQTLSYTLDVYRGHLRPWHSFLDYAMYVTFFPQLVAGPIVRAGDFLPQCERPPKRDLHAMGWGLSLFFVGLFSKQVIADLTMAPIVEVVFDGAAVPGFASAWAGTLAFAVQIFCDFAGYSACAIGIAMCLGFYLPDNFRFPYGAIGFSDFWGRWHISLSSWLRDYLYIPLGGNRKGRARTLINLCVTMLLGGLWHGASWLFVIWGGLHGLFLVSEQLLRRTILARLRIWDQQIGRITLALLTFFCVCVAWTVFRAPSLQRAGEVIRAMCFQSEGARLPNRDLVAAFSLSGVLFISHYLMRESSLKQVAERLPQWAIVSLFACIVYAIITSFAAHDRAFIYFQF